MSAPRILIVKLSSLGDILHALPVVHALREQLGAEIDWAVQPEYAALVGCFTDVARTIPVPRGRWWRGLPRTLAGLRATRYDLVIDLQGGAPGFAPPGPNPAATLAAALGGELCPLKALKADGVAGQVRGRLLG